jgi:peptide/nickel transport system substrate-binding protein
MRELDYYCKLLELGRISRREFIGRAVALGATTALATSMANQAVQAAEPKKGGRLRTALTGGSTADSLDPATILDAYMIGVSFGQLRNCLTELAPDNSLIGELAESWDASDDATEWTFKLRQGVEFHNGKTLDSTDVVESINHHRGEDSKSAAKGIIASISDIKADGADTVVFTLSGGSADFPYIMSDYHLSICPAKAEGGIDWESGVGTGGFTLDSFEPGIRTLTKRNANYWKTDINFDECETLFISDVTARTSALQTGEIDLMTNIDLKTVHLLERAPGVVVVKTTGNQHLLMPMLMDVAPFDNNELRLALKYAIDREQWLKVIAKGYGELGNDHPIGPANQFRATEEELPQRVYDPGLRQHRPEAAFGRYGLRGRRGCRLALCRDGASSGDQHRGRARAQRRLLGQRLAGQALGRQLLGRPPDGGLDVQPGLFHRGRLERDPLRQRTVHGALGRRPGGARPGQAPRDLRRDANHSAQRGRRRDSALHQLCGGRQ